MYLILLRFAQNQDRASQLAESHSEWIERGFDDGVFLLVGGLRPQVGGGILAHHTSLPELQRRVDGDPFVSEGVVTADILELAPWKADERLEFLID